MSENRIEIPVAYCWYFYKRGLFFFLYFLDSRFSHERASIFSWISLQVIIIMIVLLIKCLIVLSNYTNNFFLFFLAVWSWAYQALGRSRAYKSCMFVYDFISKIHNYHCIIRFYKCCEFYWYCYSFAYRTIEIKIARKINIYMFR